MRQFFRFLFASCLGTLLCILLIVGIAGLWAGNMVRSATKSAKVKPNTVLKLTLGQAIPERTNNTPVDPYSFELDSEEILGLTDMVDAIGRAKDDDKIKGIYLNLNLPAAGFATLSVLREALIDFKESKKFVVAYADYYTQGTYYLASTADEIYLQPQGGVDFRGLGGQVMFFKDALDRLGIKMQVYYAGKYKSATEPFRRTSMSEESKEQVREYIEDLYDVFLSDISKSRKISVEELRQIADDFSLQNAEDAVEYKFVDKLIYKDELIDLMKKKLGLDKKDDIAAMSLSAYNKGNRKKVDYNSKNRVAVIYAEGVIVDGDGSFGQTGGKKYAKMIRKIRKDKKVKAIVLRVNSGGGSAFASEEIWRELELAQKEGKPVIASFGDVAASGGYYIACGADKILAEPNTITGSIGVFGTIPSMHNFLKDKLGITADTVKTGQYSVFSNYYDLNEAEGKIVQAGVNEIYATFLQRVAEGRNMDTAEVHKIAQGRVWTGKKAKEIGLVDEFGGLQDAIELAAKDAGLKKYRVREYPAVKEPIQRFLDEIMGKSSAATATQALVKEELGDLYPHYQQLKAIKEMKGIQARLPFEVKMK